LNTSKGAICFCCKEHRPNEEAEAHYVAYLESIKQHFRRLIFHGSYFHLIRELIEFLISWLNHMLNGKHSVFSKGVRKGGVGVNPPPLSFYYLRKGDKCFGILFASLICRLIANTTE